jgi:hypothetical protein
MLVDFLTPPGCEWRWDATCHWWMLVVPTTWNYTRDAHNMEKLLFITEEFLRDVSAELAVLAVREGCRRAYMLLERLQ